MHKYLLVMVVQAFMNVCIAQTDSAFTAPSEGNEVFTLVEKMPEFKDGNLGQFILKNINMSNIDSLLKSGIEGRVFIGFIVEKDGSVSNVEVRRGAHPVLNAEAVRVVGLMPKWKPAMQNGKFVRYSMVLPLSFKTD